MGTSPLQEMRTAMTTLLRLHQDDQPVVDYVVSLIGANYLKGYSDLIWGWLVGPPGSCKTEVVRLFEPLDITYFTSTLTANALASGTNTEEGDDPSLLTRLNNKILIIKDFTILNSESEKLLGKITSDLRDANDGFYGKESGKEGHRSYHTKFGLIFCYTGLLDAFAFSQQQLGERMISLRISRHRRLREDRKSHIRHVWTAAKGKEAWRTAASEIVIRCMDTYMKKLESIEAGNVVFPVHYQEQLSELVDLIASIRTAPLRVHGLTGQAEIGSRLGLQLHHLGVARALADNRTEINQEDMNLLLRLGEDTLPSFLHKTLRTLYRNTAPVTPDLLAYHARVDGVLVGEILRQWHSLGILEPKLILLSEEIRHQITATGLFGPPSDSS